VTTHPAFRNAAHSFAAIYDMKPAPENYAVMATEEGGETFSSYFLLPCTRKDLHTGSLHRGLTVCLAAPQIIFRAICAGS
jgi:4-hydroxyphenylacetate 3-monooxygenase